MRHFSHHAPHIRLLTVTTAAEVLARLAASSPDTAAIPDVLLLDYRLPGMSALELIKAVRRMGAVDLPAVLITGHGSEEAAVQALRLGFADYLVKAPDTCSSCPERWKVCSPAPSSSASGGCSKRARPGSGTW